MLLREAYQLKREELKQFLGFGISTLAFFLLLFGLRLLIFFCSKWAHSLGMRESPLEIDLWTMLVIELLVALLAVVQFVIFAYKSLRHDARRPHP